MSVYKGRRPKTHRVVIWKDNRPHEWIVEGTRRDAERYAAQKRLELDAARIVSKRSSPRFVDFCADQYEPHAIQHLGDRTWRKVRVYQVKTLCGFFGEKKLSEISVEDVENFKRSRTVAASSVNNELRVLRTILNWAKATGYQVATIAWKKLPVRGNGRVRVWTALQLEALFAATRERWPSLLPMIVFLANTGCRKGEAIAAEWDWIDFEGAMLRIPSNEYWQPKNGLPREVPLSDAVKATLSGRREHRRWVFPNAQGERYREFPKDIWADIRTAAGLVGGPHTLRHTFASHFLKSVPDMFLLAQVMGHSHQRVTELYSHLLPDHLARARNAVNLAPRTMATAVVKRA